MLLVFFILVVTPIIMMVMTSLKTKVEVFSVERNFFPETFNLSSYLKLFRETNFPRWFLNSFIVSFFKTLFGVFICSIGGFAFAKYKFKFKNFLFFITLISVTIPQVVTIIPMFSWMAKINWISTYQVLIIPGLANAFGIYLMRQYMLGFPDELIDAARIDGCSEFRIYYRISLPIVKPGVGALAIFLFLSSWTEYLWPLVMTSTSEMQTMPLGLATFYASMFDREITLLMAGSIISTLPILILFLFMQEQFIAGLTAGAIKE